MEYVLLIIIIFTLFGVSSKLDVLNEKLDFKDDEKIKKRKNFILDDYAGKLVHVVLDNDDITDSLPFSDGSNTYGKITSHDEEWFEYVYYDKSKRKDKTRYFRIKDIVSIDEIKNSKKD